MQNNIIEKIRKLLALAANNSSIEESASAASKAQAMLLEHHLSMAEIDLKEKPEEIQKHDLNIGGNKRTIVWRQALHHRIAQAHFCKTIFYPGTTKKTIVGKPTHIQIVQYLYDYLSKEIERQYKGWVERECFLSKPNFRSYALGAVAGIHGKFMEQRKATENTVGQACTALVVAEDKEVSVAFRQYFPHTTKVARTRIGNAEAYHAGRVAGGNMNIPQGVGSRSTTLLS